MWICNYDSSSKHRLAVGLTYTPWCDFTLATLTVPSLLVLTSITLAKGQVEWGTPVSAMRTRSPTWKFLFLTFHFFLLVNKGTYTFKHLRQNMSVAACTALHLFLRLMSSVLVTHGCKFGLGLPNRKWFGVIGSKSSISSLAGVRGRLLIILSPSVRKVDNASSVNNLSFTIVFNAFFVSFTIASMQPPIHGLDGGLNFHWIRSGLNSSLILCWSNFCIASDNSRWAPTKFVPLSLVIVWGLPFLAVNLRSAQIKLSVERSPANSICKAREAKHVNIAPYCLEIAWFDLVFLENLTNNGAK